MKKNKTVLMVLWWAAAVVLLARCTPIDYHYRDYLQHADKAYPGRVDSIEFMPGNGRAAIRSRISTDSRVTHMRLSWGNNQHFETAILPEDIAKFKEVIIPSIDEGVYTFEIRTMDVEGNQSMRSEIFGRVYGAGYEANLNNRIVNFIGEDAEGLVVNWFSESADSTLLGTVISYLTTAGDSAHVFTRRSVNETVLPGFQDDTKFTFRTLYKPTPLAIDTFYAATQTIDPADYMAGDRTPYTKESWSIAGFSSENNGDRHAVANLLDNTAETFWIARFSSPATDYPDHWVTIDMNEALAVDGFYFAQKNGDRKIRELEIRVSNDNDTWESLGLFGLANIDRDNQFVDLPAQKTFRYFKLVPVSGHDSQRQPGLADVGTFRFGD